MTSDTPAQETSWPVAFFLATAVPALFVAMEWLFFATKPSFLTPLAWSDRVATLAAATFLPAAAGALLAAVVALVARLVPPAASFLRRVVAIFVALVGALLVLLLVENFTRTIFGFGIIEAKTAGRIVYLAGLFGVAVIAYRAAAKRMMATRGDSRAALAAALLLLVIGIAGSAIEGGQDVPDDASLTQSSRHFPHVIILGSDGLEAQRMTPWGSERDTTPFLTRLAQESLVADAAFANAANTGGSVTSILTGRLPSSTGVLYPPEILRGADAFRHLPALLKSRGYTSLQVTVRHYGDAFDLNFRRAFDVANDRRSPDVVSARLAPIVGDDASYLLYASWQRLEERLLHLSGRERMRDVYQEVTTAPTGHKGDELSIEKLEQFIDASRQPVFAHVHLMGTHGPLFEPKNRRWSGGKEQDTYWLTDFYDDAISDFDSAVGRFVAHLRKRGLLDDTILIIYSDHGRNYDTTQRVPLMIRFPKQQHRGRIARPVQNLDIAPTILEALGAATPSWMEGASLLRTQPSCKPIFAFASDPFRHKVENGQWISSGTGKLGSLGAVTLLHCNTAWVAFLGGPARTALTSFPLTDAAGKVGGDCNCPPMDEKGAAAAIVEHLRLRACAVQDGAEEALLASRAITRREAARILVAGLHGAAFVPPASPSTFLDIRADDPGLPWIEQAVADGTIRGCTRERFCPNAFVDRALLAGIAVKLFGIPEDRSSHRLTDLAGIESVRPNAEAAVKARLVEECAPTKFCPGALIARDDLERLVARRAADKRP